MNIIVVIPARAGSKRLPGKNVKLLNGIPLIEYSIDYALNNKILEKNIIVTTDDIEVIKIANKYDVSIINRPKHLSGDLISSLEVLKHVVENIENIDDIDWVVLLQPTNPLRPNNLLIDALNILETKKFDSLMTVSKNHQKFGKIINEKFVPFNYTFGQRSQDLEPLFFENGLLYISKPNLILNDKIIGNNAFPFIIDHPFSKVDIDTIEDFNFAEFTLNNYK